MITIPKVAMAWAPWKWGLLPSLIAALVMVMFFSMSQSSPDAQAASQGTAVAMELRVPAQAQVGSNFTVRIWANLTPAVPISGFGVSILVDTGAGGVSYNGASDCLAEVKPRPADNFLALCDSYTPFLTGGHAWSALTDLLAPGDALVLGTSSKVVLVNASYSCNILGTHEISLGVWPSDPDGAVYGTLDQDVIAVKSEAHDVDTDGDTNADVTMVADTATITCVANVVGGVAELPEVAGTPLGTDGSARANVGIAVAVAAGAMTLGGAAWYARRRRL